MADLKYCFCITSIILVALLLVRIRGDGVEVYNSIFHFPPGSPYMGMFLAIAIPLNNRGLADVFFSLNFEASYSLPQNQTQFIFPPIISDTVTRQFVYNMLESNMKAYGIPGKSCLLRAICEAADYTSESTGVLGDLLHVLLTMWRWIEPHPYKKAKKIGTLAPQFK